MVKESLQKMLKEIMKSDKVVEVKSDNELLSIIGSVKGISLKISLGFKNNLYIKNSEEFNKLVNFIKNNEGKVKRILEIIESFNGNSSSSGLTFKL